MTMVTMLTRARGRLVVGPVLVWATLAGGCALADSTLTVQHPIPVSRVSTSAIPVFFAGVTDQRPDMARIGCKRNGYGMETADLFLDMSVSTWFGQAMAEGLVQAGLVPAAAESSAAQLGVVLLGFFIEPEVGFSQITVYAMVDAEIRVVLPDGRQYARRFAAVAHKGTLLITDTDYTNVMQQAMQSWLAQAVPEVVAFVEAAAAGRM